MIDYQQAHINPIAKKQMPGLFGMVLAPIIENIVAPDKNDGHREEHDQGNR